MVSEVSDVRPVVIVSNRGPVSFHRPGPGQAPVARRGAGGLVSGLGPLVRDTTTVWVAAAMTEDDRAVAQGGLTSAEGFRIRLLDIDPAIYARHYDEVCNRALWFVHHGLFDAVYEPSWPPGWMDDAWAAHREVNRAFAAAVAADAPEGAAVLVQDYHLCLMALDLVDARPDLRLVHFSHTPFAPPAWLRMLPDPARRELLAGLAAHHACGFHTDRWASEFLDCCADEGVSPPPVFSSPLGPDPDDLSATAVTPAAMAARSELDDQVGDAALIVRVDRIELSKNLLRGFDAFERLLDASPERRSRVVFGAFVYPSRTNLEPYRVYAEAVRRRVDEINGRFATDDWTPILFDDGDHYPRSIAALARADVILVNPIRDGMNLVAKEAMLVNERHGQLVLSPEAGAWDELGIGAWRADPFDVGATAEALLAALDLEEPERGRRSDRLAAAARSRTPADWLADQLTAAG